MSSHAAAARCLYGNEAGLVDDVLHDMQQSAVSDKMKGLLHIAGKVQVLGKEVTESDVLAARAAGATDRDIHDTVLIAAAFCMYNRYVDGLASFTPADPEVYADMGKLWFFADDTSKGNRFCKGIEGTALAEEALNRSQVISNA